MTNTQANSICLGCLILATAPLKLALYQSPIWFIVVALLVVVAIGVLKKKGVVQSVPEKEYYQAINNGVKRSDSAKNENSLE